MPRAQKEAFILDTSIFLSMTGAIDAFVPVARASVKDLDEKLNEMKGRLKAIEKELEDRLEFYENQIKELDAQIHEINVANFYSNGDTPSIDTSGLEAERDALKKKTDIIYGNLHFLYGTIRVMENRRFEYDDTAKRDFNDLLDRGLSEAKQRLHGLDEVVEGYSKITARL